MNEQEVAKALSTFVNGGGDLGKLAAEMANDHPTLVQRKFSLVLQFVYELADRFDKMQFDARSEYSCNASKLIKDTLENAYYKDAWRTPFI